MDDVGNGVSRGDILCRIRRRLRIEQIHQHRFDAIEILVLRKLSLLRSEGFALGKTDEKLPDSVVWGHKGTRIFCRSTCHTTARVDRTKIMFFADPGEARQAGLRPCKICRP